MDTKKGDKRLVSKTQIVRKEIEISPERPVTSTLSTEERLRVLANIIIDRILENQQMRPLELSK